MDVSLYLARIGAELRSPPSHETLQYLHEQHLWTVPFENLDIGRGVPIVLEKDRILDKVVRRRRGGFCYELNCAFHWLLTGLGYDVTMLSAEVAGSEGGFGIPFDHMTLLVRIGDERFLADVGFGDSFRTPLPFCEDLIHDEGELRYRLSRQDDSWLLERRAADEERFTPQYRFTTTPRRLDDFRDGCTYHQTSPESHFTRSVVVSVALPDGRLTLTRDRLIRRRGGDREETPIPDEHSWKLALETHFGIVLEDP